MNALGVSKPSPSWWKDSILKFIISNWSFVISVLGFFDSLLSSHQQFSPSVISYLSPEHLLVRSSSFLWTVGHCFHCHHVGCRNVCMRNGRDCPFFTSTAHSEFFYPPYVLWLSSLSHWNSLYEIMQWHVAAEMYGEFPVRSVSLIIYLCVLQVPQKQPRIRRLWTGFPASGHWTLFV